MQLILSFPEHLADEALFITQAAGGEEGTPQTTVASSDSDDDSGNGALAGVIQLVLFGGIAVAFYFLMIRPRRRALREHQALQSSVTVGDEVLLTSGVYGFVTGMEDGSDVVWVEIDDDVQVRVSRAAIARKVEVSASPETDADGATTRPSLKGGSGASGSSAGRTEPAETADPVDE